MDRNKIVGFLKSDGVTVLIVIVLIAVYAILRTPASEFKSMEQLEAALSSGAPTIVEFYSNNCSICLTSKPTVDQMERDLRGQAVVLRINVKDAVGRNLAGRWGVQAVPTFVVLDGNGNITHAQVGAPDVSAIKAAVGALVSPTP